MVEQNKEKGTAKGNLAQRRIELQVALDAARQSGDPEAIRKAEAKMSALTQKVDLAKQIDHKSHASTFKIADINQRNGEFQRRMEDVNGSRALANEKLMSAGAIKATDPFARLPIRPVSYWTVGKDKEAKDKEKAAKEAAEKEQKEADKDKPPQLVVETDVQSGVKESAISPGFKELLATPRVADEGAEVDDPFDFGPASAKGVKGAGAPTGALAEAHDIDIDIDLDLAPEPAAKPKPRAPPPAAAAPSAGGGAGSRLSVADYRRRAGLVGAD